jgi:hypothetical protein
MVCILKAKAIPATGRGGPYGADNRLTAVRLAALSAGRDFTPERSSGTHLY